MTKCSVFYTMQILFTLMFTFTQEQCDCVLVVYINYHTQRWKKVLCNFYLQKGIHANFIVCIPANDKEAPEIANIMQREHNRSQ